MECRANNAEKESVLLKQHLEEAKKRLDEVVVLQFSFHFFFLFLNLVPGMMVNTIVSEGKWYC